MTNLKARIYRQYLEDLDSERITSAMIFKMADLTTKDLNKNVTSPKTYMIKYSHRKKEGESAGYILSPREETLRRQKGVKVKKAMVTKDSTAKMIRSESDHHKLPILDSSSYKKKN